MTCVSTGIRYRLFTKGATKPCFARTPVTSTGVAVNHNRCIPGSFYLYRLYRTYRLRAHAVRTSVENDSVQNQTFRKERKKKKYEHSLQKKTQLRLCIRPPVAVVDLY